MKAKERARQAFNQGRSKQMEEKKAAALTPEQVAAQEKAKQIHHLKINLQNLSYTGSRAVDALELLNQATFPGTAAGKVFNSTSWLQAVCSDIERQMKEYGAKLNELEPPKNMEAPAGTKPALEVVSPDKKETDKELQ